MLTNGHADDSDRRSGAVQVLEPLTFPPPPGPPCGFGDSAEAAYDAALVTALRFKPHPLASRLNVTCRLNLYPHCLSRDRCYSQALSAALQRECGISMALA